MIHYLYILTFGLLIFFQQSLYAQDLVVDSLKLALKNAKHDTTRIKILSELSELCEVEDILIYAEPCKKLCEKSVLKNSHPKTFYLKYLADAINNIGFLALEHGDVQKALEYYSKSLLIRENISDVKGIGTSVNNIGYIYISIGENSKALMNSVDFFLAAT